MFKDPAFTARVKERFDFFYNHRDDIMKEIDDNADYLRCSIEENNEKWKVFSSSNTWKKYQQEVQTLKDWIEARFEWMKTAIDEL